MPRHSLRHILLFWSVNVARLVLAATFIFSGFVKAADPMGMFHKLGVYFAHWGYTFPLDSVVLRGMVVCLAVVEFVLGLHFLLGMRMRLTAWCSSLFMLAMTLLTIYIYRYEPVADCGCFGDAYVLSNGATLAKNVVLLLLCGLCLFAGRYTKRFISERNQWLTSIYTWVYVLGLSLYTLHYVPILEFTDYRNGTHWRDAWEGRFSADAPESLSTLCFTDARTGDDVTEQILDSGYCFLLTMPEISTADAGNNDRINDIYDECVDNGYRFFLAVGEPWQKEDLQHWMDQTGAAYPVVSADAVQLKAMVRSNPGLLLLRDGIQIRKWSNNDLPILNDALAQQTYRNSIRGIIGLPNDNGDWRAQPETSRYFWKRPLGQLVLWYIIPLLAIMALDNIWVGSKYYRRYTQRRRLRRQQNAQATPAPEMGQQEEAPAEENQ